MPLQPHLLFLTEIGALSCTSDLRCSCQLVSCLGGSVKRPGEDCREGRRNPRVSFLLLSQLVVCLTMVVSPLWFRLFLGSCYYSLCLAAYHSHSSHRRSPETSCLSQALLCLTSLSKIPKALPTTLDLYPILDYLYLHGIDTIFRKTENYL